jgi:hypothetical protein
LSGIRTRSDTTRFTSRPPRCADARWIKRRVRKGDARLWFKENPRLRRRAYPSIEKLSLVTRVGTARINAAQCPQVAVRPEGANHQWRKNPPGELSIDPVADERLVRVTARVGAS